MKRSLSLAICASTLLLLAGCASGESGWQRGIKLVMFAPDRSRVTAWLPRSEKSDNSARRQVRLPNGTSVTVLDDPGFQSPVPGIADEPTPSGFVRVRVTAGEYAGRELFLLQQDLSYPEVKLEIPPWLLISVAGGAVLAALYAMIRSLAGSAHRKRAVARYQATAGPEGRFIPSRRPRRPRLVTPREENFDIWVARICVWNVRFGRKDRRESSEFGPRRSGIRWLEPAASEPAASRSSS